MRTVVLISISLLCGLVLGYLGSEYIHSRLDDQVITPASTAKPLLRYTFSNLQSYIPQPSHITLETTMASESGVTIYQGSYRTDEKQMSLQIMFPTSATPAAGFPVILMNRGFVDPAQYQPGVGTKNAAKVFAANGFVTVAPDFLGFGTSDAAPDNTMAARLEKPRQLLDLIASFSSLPNVNPTKIGLWGHSNGGQIVLSLLEISRQPYPTVLWAPVSKPFPYSLLYYTDEYDDGGKALRKVVANFEQDYDVDDYSIDKFIKNITASIQIHQGTADDAVPESWSKSLTTALKEIPIPVTYYVYEGADHNLRPAWQVAVDRSLVFFTKSLYGNNQ